MPLCPRPGLICGTPPSPSHCSRLKHTVPDCAILSREGSVVLQSICHRSVLCLRLIMTCSTVWATGRETLFIGCTVWTWLTTVPRWRSDERQTLAQDYIILPKGRKVCSYEQVGMMNYHEEKREARIERERERTSEKQTQRNRDLQWGRSDGSFGSGEMKNGVYSTDSHSPILLGGGGHSDNDVTGLLRSCCRSRRYGRYQTVERHGVNPAWDRTIMGTL